MHVMVLFIVDIADRNKRITILWKILAVTITQVHMSYSEVRLSPQGAVAQMVERSLSM